MRARLGVPLLLLALGCEGVAPGDDAGESGGSTKDSAATTGTCAEAPIVNWNNFGEAFLIHQCNGCHAATTPERYGAPADVSFDTVEQAWAWAPRILARATGDTPSMPPRGGVSDDDRQRLVWWLSCAEAGT